MKAGKKTTTGPAKGKTKKKTTAGTYGTRLSDEQLELARKAAGLRGWSLAQFMQRATVERASEIINRHEDRGRVSAVAGQLAAFLEETTPEFGFSMAYEGEMWDTDDRSWNNIFFEKESDSSDPDLRWSVRSDFVAVWNPSVGNVRFYRYEVSPQEIESLYDGHAKQWIDETQQASKPELMVSIKVPPQRSVAFDLVSRAIRAGGREFSELLEDAHKARGSSDSGTATPIDADALLRD